MDVQANKICKNLTKENEGNLTKKKQLYHFFPCREYPQMTQDNKCQRVNNVIKQDKANYFH